MLRTGITLLCWLVGSSAWAAEITIRTPITESEKQKLDAFIAGRSITSIRDYRSVQLDSIAPLEHFLFRKAVLLGGLDARFEDFIVPTSARARESLRGGTALAGGTAQWHVYFPAVQDKVLESDEVIKRGWYEKGLYTTRLRLPDYPIKTDRDLSKYVVVTSKTWEVDWATLNTMSFASVHSAPTRATQFKMIAGGHGDFTLQDFSSRADLSIEEQGITLFPVPGVKIALSGTRHFWVYKDNPASSAVFEALQRGLRLLHQQGEIKRALTESGIRNAAVESWTPLAAP